MLTGEASIPQASRNPLEVPLITVATRRYRWEGFCLGLRTRLSEPFLLERPRAVHCPSITWRDRGYPAVCSGTIKDVPDITRSYLRTAGVSWLTLHRKGPLGLFRRLPKARIEMLWGFVSSPPRKLAREPSLSRHDAHCQALSLRSTHRVQPERVLGEPRQAAGPAAWRGEGTLSHRAAAQAIAVTPLNSRRSPPWKYGTCRAC